jgi:TatD DNase family protein
MSGEIGQFIDTHVHLDYLRQPGEEVFFAQAAGVSRMVVPGVWRQGWAGLLQLANEIPGVLAAPGLHPQAAGEWNAAAERELAELLASTQVVAVGEIGLDRIAEPPPVAQETAFRGQLRLALAAGRPVLIHCRRASALLLRILREEGAWQVGGILHAFSGSPETAAAAVDLGFAIGFGGPLTWENARRAPELLRALPAEAIVLETDAPDLPPQPHRGRENRPAWLTLVATRMAEIRGWSLQETARITTANACRVLRLPDYKSGVE